MAKNKTKVCLRQSIDPKVGQRVEKMSKNTSKPKQCPKKVKTICKYPQEVTEMSANWKRLSQELNQNKSIHKNKGFIKNLKQKKSIESKTEDKNKIWFDGVDKCLITSSMVDNNVSNDKSDEKLVKQKSFMGLTRIVAMDCEMVGTGSDATNSVLARVSIVNFFGHCVYDKYVKTIEEVTDYRTHVSGIRPSHLVNAPDFKTVQKEVHEILKDRMVVGHALSNDFKALFLSHPKNKIRDTSRYFRKLLGGRTPALRKLSETVLGVKVQTGEHDSVEDARVAMRLFTMFRKKWESDLKKNQIIRQKKK